MRGGESTKTPFVSLAEIGMIAPDQIESKAGLLLTLEMGINFLIP